MDVALGFDPGGEAQFGWAILERGDAPLPRVRVSGVALHAKDALSSVVAHLASDDVVKAAGIDSPMYWTATGARAADQRVREAMRARGAANVGGTVQHPNSLRGACVVQGPTLGILLRQWRRALPITEAHPKALLWLLDVARRANPVSGITGADLWHLVRCEVGIGEHERDAVLGAYAALQMLAPPTGWIDLVAEEADPIFVTGTVAYWMPLPARKPSERGAPAGYGNPLVG